METKPINKPDDENNKKREIFGGAKVKNNVLIFYASNKCPNKNPAIAFITESGKLHILPGNDTNGLQHDSKNRIPISGYTPNEKIRNIGYNKYLDKTWWEDSYEWVAVYNNGYYKKCAKYPPDESNSLVKLIAVYRRPLK